MSKERIITDGDVPQAVHDAVAAGQKIVAIKLLREATGIGLANAKVIVDRLATRHARNHPRQTAVTEVSSTPRVLALMVLVVAIVAAWRYFGTA